MTMASSVSLGVFLLALVGCPWVVSAFDNGAPMGSCTTLAQSHGTQAPTFAGSITASSTSFSLNNPITVTISGSCQGFVMQARRVTGSTTPIGTWIAVPSNTKSLQCTLNADTVTHSNTNIKTNAKFTWNPPSFNPGDIQFVATVSQSYSIYVKNVKSSVLASSGYATGPVLAGNQIKVSSFLLIASLLFLALFK